MQPGDTRLSETLYAMPGLHKANAPLREAPADSFAIAGKVPRASGPAPAVEAAARQSPAMAISQARSVTARFGAANKPLADAHSGSTSAAFTAASEGLPNLLLPPPLAGGYV
jgi:hypothetical protein